MAAHASHLAVGTGSRWLMLAAEMADLASGSRRPSPDLAQPGWALLLRDATRRLGADAGSVRTARDFATDTLRWWGIAERSHDLAIVVSELVTNALRHALPGPGGAEPRGPVQLGLLQHGCWLLCAVADPGKAAPVPRTPGVLAEAGRGLQMVRVLSDQWGYTTPSDEGKVVWATFTALPTPPSPVWYTHRRGRDRISRAAP